MAVATRKPTSVQHVLSRLTARDTALLNYAFDRGIPAHVEYTRGRYIGVHLPHHRSRAVEAIAGYYSMGRFR